MVNNKMAEKEKTSRDPSRENTHVMAKSSSERKTAADHSDLYSFSVGTSVTEGEIANCSRNIAIFRSESRENDGKCNLLSYFQVLLRKNRSISFFKNVQVPMGV